MRLGWALWVILLLWGCAKDERPAPDRTIERLKAEQQRLNQGGRPGGPPTAAAALLEQAIATPVAPRALPLQQARARHGDLLLEMRGAVVSQTVEGVTTSVATAERFLRVVFQATATTRQSLELGSAFLQRGADTAPVARDAQLVGRGTSLTAITIEPGAPRELVVYFEASPTMLGPGLKMVLSPAGSRVELPLE